MAKDYFKILGVGKTATKDEIKKAYRKLAMKFHPDKNKDNKQAEEKFKEINEAYAVLSNDKKRKQYNQFGAEGFSKRFSQEDIFRGFDIGSIFREFGLGDSFFGDDLFSNIFRGRQKSRNQEFHFDMGEEPFFQQGNRPHSNQNAEVELHVSLEDVVLGSTKKFAFKTAESIENLNIKIPIGIEEGQKLRLKGKGLVDPFNGQRGDLYCKIVVDPHPRYKRNGNDLILEMEIKLTDMVLGGKIRITTLDKKTIELKIPPHTQNNSCFRIKGKGIPSARNRVAGNLLVRIHPKLPNSLTSEQKKIFHNLAQQGF